jgi:hypothetical protein
MPPCLLYLEKPKISGFQAQRNWWRIVAWHITSLGAPKVAAYKRCRKCCWHWGIQCSIESRKDISHFYKLIRSADAIPSSVQLFICFPSFKGIFAPLTSHISDDISQEIVLYRLSKLSNTRYMKNLKMKRLLAFNVLAANY